jgi:hypothetical protein
MKFWETHRPQETSRSKVSLRHEVGAAMRLSVRKVEAAALLAVVAHRGLTTRPLSSRQSTPHVGNVKNTSQLIIISAHQNRDCNGQG